MSFLKLNGIYVIAILFALGYSSYLLLQVDLNYKQANELPAPTPMTWPLAIKEEKVFNKSCQDPKQFVVFHKTHKCSSTTIQNILLRYAYKHNLTVVLPSQGNEVKLPFSSSIKTTEWFRAGLIPNIFCLHNHRWSYLQVAELGVALLLPWLYV